MDDRLRYMDALEAENRELKAKFRRLKREARSVVRDRGEALVALDLITHLMAVTAAGCGISDPHQIERLGYAVIRLKHVAYTHSAVAESGTDEERSVFMQNLLRDIVMPY